MKIHHSGGVSNLPIRAKLRDYKSHRPDALVGFPSFTPGDRTQMTTKEGRQRHN
jgi:hypothetical protein